MSIQRFAGKVSVMTGATMGIGLATARRLGKEGCKVVVSSRRQANVDEAVDLLQKDGIDASGVTCHQGNPDDRQKLMKYAIDKHGGFDSLFLNAGVNPHFGSLLTVGEREFQKDHFGASIECAPMNFFLQTFVDDAAISRIFDVNVKSNFMFIRESMPQFAKRGGGSIVTNATAVSGDLGMMYVGRDIRLYAISKLALAAMTGHVARDCYNQNVRVNCVLPGVIKTQFAEGGVTPQSYLQHMDAFGIGHNELAGRRGEPDDVSGVVAFLLSDDAAYMSGQCLGCAGGLGPLSHVF